MGVRVLESKDGKMAALYCSTSMWAFGPIFYESEDGKWSPTDSALAFLHWLGGDPRIMTDEHLERAHHEWRVSLTEKEEAH